MVISLLPATGQVGAAELVDEDAHAAAVEVADGGEHVGGVPAQPAELGDDEGDLFLGCTELLKLAWIQFRKYC